MMRHLMWLMAVTQLSSISVVNTAKQKVMLSDSYLPVAMQVIAHLVDQMAYETTDQPPATTKPSTSRPIIYTTTTKRPSAFASNRPNFPPIKPSTSRPIIYTTTTKRPSAFATSRPTFPPINPPAGGWKPGQTGGWSMNVGSAQTSSRPSVVSTTPFHKPGLFAPIAPPKPNERLASKHQLVFLPLSNEAEEYTVLKPEDQNNEETLLAPETKFINPILHNNPVKDTLLPLEKYVPINPHVSKDYVLPRSADDVSTLHLDEHELNDNNLQYLGEDLRDMLKLAHDPNDERAFDIADEGLEKQLVSGKPAIKVQKLSQSNLRMLLLYDLLSREAKRQKLSDYGGFSESVMKELAESARGGARPQLAFALSKMLDRKDCEHEYANNRAKEMVAELKKDDSLLSAETRYLQPLNYKLY